MFTVVFVSALAPLTLFSIGYFDALHYRKRGVQLNPALSGVNLVAGTWILALASNFFLLATQLYYEVLGPILPYAYFFVVLLAYGIFRFMRYEKKAKQGNAPLPPARYQWLIIVLFVLYLLVGVFWLFWLPLL